MSSSNITRNASSDSSTPVGQLPSHNTEYSLVSEDAADDDDIDFEPAAEESDDLEVFETEGDDEGGNGDDEDTEGEFHGAEDGGGEFGIEISFDSDANANGERSIRNATVTQPTAAAGPVQVSRAQIFHLLGHTGLHTLLTQQATTDAAPQVIEDDDDDLSNYGFFAMGIRRQRRAKAARAQRVLPPSAEGKRLMQMGTFGRNERYQDRLRKIKQRVPRLLMERELGLGAELVRDRNQTMSQHMIPSSEADTIIHYNSRCYSGQFSDDGNFFFSCAQDFKVRMYDTSNPYDWKHYKTVLYPFGQWTITDATLSPDNRYLAYSSIRSSVCLAVTDPRDSSEPSILDFSDIGEPSTRARGHIHGNTNFGIWSVRFSGDGRELVAGTSDSSVYVFDIEAKRSILRIPGHKGDVNAVCFGDASSPHILYSGSDDTLIKVWDRRSMGDSREAGVFMGHTEGLTYVDSKGDGRYVLSNGKDQTMKLWDLRKMMSTEQSAKIDRNYRSGFDYRCMAYSDFDYVAHPSDCSLITYRGHSVLKTLIRCHFSPPGSTNSRYVYSGGEDGKVHIYNMDNTVAGTIDVRSATFESRPRDNSLQMNALGDNSRPSSWETCVRDASWHPNAPVLAATSWNGWDMSTGTCTIHSWNDGAKEDESEEKIGVRVDHQLEPDPGYYGQPASRPSARAVLPSRTVARADSDGGAAD